jgi:hypothetical protein
MAEYNCNPEFLIETFKSILIARREAAVSPMCGWKTQQ